MFRAFSVVLLLCLPSLASAGDMLRARITAAESHALLSQRMMRNLCFLEIGVNVDQNRRLLSSSKQQFDTTIHALKTGGGPKEFAPETDVQTLTQIAKVEELWLGFRTQIDAFDPDGLHTAKELLDLSELSLGLLEAAKALKTLYVERYKEQSMFAAMIPRTMADVSSRQSMLIQKAGKDLCLTELVRGTDNAPQQIAHLKDTLDLFDRSAFGLTFSSQEMELPVPPSAEIEEENFANWQQWNNAAALFYLGIEQSVSDTDFFELSLTIEFMTHALEETALKYASL